MSAKNKFEDIKKSFLGFLSGLAFVAIVWALFFGRIKAIEFLSPLIQKIPKDDNKLTELTEKILGSAAEKIKEGNAQKYIEKGSELFESSQYAEPARQIRENIKERIDEVVDSVKELPAQEVRIIKKQVCQQWFEETATESANE